MDNNGSSLCAFLATHDMSFERLPSCWQEAPHFGNAMLGSMLYLKDGRLCLEIFRADVRDHRDESYGWTAYSRPRLRIGYFELCLAGTPTACSLRQDLWNAELTGTVVTDQGEIGIRHFVHSVDMAIVTELAPSGGETDVAWLWHPAEAKTSRPGYPETPEEIAEFAKRYGEHYRETLKPWKPNPPGGMDRQGEVSVWSQDLLAGGQYATAWGRRGQDGTTTYVVTIANSYPEKTAAKFAVADIARFPETDSEAWRASHRKWWHDYYPRSFVSIPDKELESHYWRNIYRLGCTSRAGRFYVDTSGIWFQGGPWPYTTNDWNTQSAHWGVYAANRLEQGEELVNRLHANSSNLIKAVHPDEWQEDSAFLHIATTGDFSGTSRSDMRYYHCVGCLPWLLHNAWWQYRFSMDDAMLREKIYPLLRRAVNLYLHIAEKDADGRIHLKPTYSPETGVWRDASFDLALFKWGCHILLKSSRRLKIEDPLIPRWREVVDTLADFHKDEKGFMLGSEQSAWDEHRHLSHLLMIYPLYLVNIDQPGTRDLLGKSSRSADGSTGSDNSADLGALQAMVQTHAGPIAAALGAGDTVLAGLKRMVREFHPNGLWSCSGNPCFESTVALVNNIQEMLIQSWSDPAADEPGPIRVFPALPSAWREVEFCDLRTEGAFLVSAKRRGGRTEWVRIKSLAGEPCRIRTDIPVPACRINGVDVDVSPGHDGLVTLQLAKGDEAVLREVLQTRGKS